MSSDLAIAHLISRIEYCDYRKPDAVFDFMSHTLSLDK